MDTAQNLQSPKEVVERISGAMTLSCSQCALLKCMVRHIALVMFNNSFKVTSMQVSAFPWYPELCIPTAPLTDELGSKLSGRSVLCPITQLSKQQRLRTESEHVGVEPVLPSCRGAFGRLCLGSCIRGIFSPASFYIVLLPEGSRREDKSLFF